MRTTIDLDDDILRALKRRQREERKTLGQLASELLAQALAAEPPPNVDIRWSTADLRPVWILTTRTLFGRFWTVGERNL